MTIPLTRAEKEDIKHNIQTVVDLIEFYGLETKNYNLLPTIKHWEELTQNTQHDNVEDGGQKIFKSRVITLTKYKMAAYVASLTNTPLPEAPFTGVEDKPDVLIGGRFHQFMTKFVLRPGYDKVQRLSIIQSLIQAKGGLTKPDSEFVRYAEIKTFEKLTKPKETKESPMVDKIKNELRRTVREIFTKNGKKMRYTDNAKFAYSLPSQNAHYNNSRGAYGALGHLLKHVEPLKLQGCKLMGFERVVNEEDDDMRESGPDMYKVDATKLTKAVYDFRKRVLEEAQTEIPLAVPLGLSEPGKPRVITKGPPATYYILKPLQKFMHNHMRTLPVFELLGKTVSSRIISDCLPHLRSDEKILSGDYSDATNELEAWVTDEITDELVYHLDLSGEEHELINKSLTQHIIQLRDKEGKDVVQEANQVNGQLMGSILSFLWLCIANLTLVRISKEEGDGETYTLETLMARINGDDCLFTASLEVRSAWEDFGNIMGLKPSLGKVFWSREFCTLNSRMFIPPTKLGGQFSEIPFISLGLLYDIEKSTMPGKKEERVSPLKGIETIGARNQWLMMGCPIHLRKVVQTKFLHIHRILLDRSKLDWFMPEWSGGLGICDVSEEGWILNATIPFPGNPIPSYDDEGQTQGIYKIFDDKRNESSRHTKSRSALFHMINNWGNPKFTPRPLSSSKLPTNLNIINVVQTYFPVKPVEKLLHGTEKVENDIYDQVFGLAAMAAYLTDEALQSKIKGDLENATNLENSRYYVEKNAILLLGREEKDKDKVVYEFKKNEMDGKKRKRAIEKYVGDVLEEEYIKRIKYNRAVWKNNLQKGCGKLANWKFLQNRSYAKIFFGTLSGKGVKTLQESLYGEFSIPEEGPWSYERTMQLLDGEW